MNDQYSFSEFRANMKKVMDEACDRHEPVLIKRRGGADMVVVSREDYEEMNRAARAREPKLSVLQSIEAVSDALGEVELELPPRDQGHRALPDCN